MIRRIVALPLAVLWRLDVKLSGVAPSRRFDCAYRRFIGY